jgi:hypothetical protein
MIDRSDASDEIDVNRSDDVKNWLQDTQSGL